MDASYAIALASPRDQHHGRAVDLAGRIESGRTALVTTRAVVLEIGNALSRLRHRHAAILLLDALEHDPGIEVVELNEDLYVRALELYGRHSDKEWGLTDCVSFVVMRERGIGEALTADAHFLQAGFAALLAAAP
jgi:uncharacterized protein